MSSVMYGKNGAIRLRARTFADSIPAITVGFMALVTVAGFFMLDGKGVSLIEGLSKTGRDLGVMFASPAFKHLTLGETARQIAVTLSLAFLTTVLGAAIALFLALAAARNLARGPFGPFLKGFIAVVRAVPTVLWVLIFAIGAGLGAVAAVVGMVFHTIGYLLKAYSESYEEIDSGVIEALRASGASWWQIVFQAVFPASMTAILSWTFIRFEINFVTAVAMGAAAGAGGIGFDLFMASSFYFDLREVGSITWAILAVAIALEAAGERMKRSF